MLNTLKLTNFRRHTDLSINFTQGLNAIRAANEGGKSTTTEALNYALFGSRALRTSMEQTVTWGHDLKTMKVEANVTANGQTYTFTRGKSGAEVILNGEVFVTGQNEVSIFAAGLIGADVTLAPRLMLASQNGIRGALEEGPKALAEMIENLAGFEAFDDILETAQSKLNLGSPSAYEGQLSAARATLESATQSMPVKPDEEDHNAKLTQLANLITTTEAELPGLRKTIDEKVALLSSASNKFLEHQDMAKNVTRVREQVQVAMATVAGHEANASKIKPDLAPLQAALANAKNLNERKVAYKAFLELPTGDFFPNTQEEFEAVLAAKTKDVAEMFETVRSYETEIATTKAKRLNHSKCDKCGQEVGHLETVVKNNAEVDAKIGHLETLLGTAKANHTAGQAALDYVLAQQKFATAYDRAAAAIALYVTGDENTYPRKATWAGELPTEGASVAQCQADLTAAETKVKEIEQAETRLEMAKGQRDQLVAQLEELDIKLAEHMAPTPDELLNLEAEKNEAVLDLSARQDIIAKAVQESVDLARDFGSASQLWNMAHQRVADAEVVITSTTAAIDKLNFNNALVKKIRAIRPIVANQVWNQVLTSVSVMFSQIRGEESWVTKAKDGFQVNGQAVESLSGSTLDILGIALRVALLKVFLPQCGLLVLDEPAQGCDPTRTESLLGFIAASGIGQTILITHEETSESVADNIIEL